VSIEHRPATPDLPNKSAQDMHTLTRTTGSYAFDRPQAGATVALAQRLFTAPERWGWEYVEPRPPQPHPDLADYPQWVEPMGADLAAHQQALAAARWKLRTRLKIAGGLFLLGLFVSAGSGALGTLMVLGALGLAGFAAYQIYAPQEAMKRAQAEAAARRESVHAMFLDAKRRWDEQIARHDAAERHRYATDPLLFPLSPASTASRVDVVGGTSAGWAAMLATMGSSVLATGGTMLVLDLSRHDVTGPLCSLADEIRVPRRAASVPAALEAPWLLGDLQPRALADVLATAIDSLRNRNDGVDLAPMDAEIIRTVGARIERPFTFARLAAGVRVLRGLYDPDEETLLSAGEVTRLTERIDVLARGDKMRDEMGFVENQLDVLAASEAGATEAGDATSLWPARGLAVLRSDAQGRTGRDARSVVDRVAFAAVLHQLAGARVDAQDPTLVVAGADDLGRSALQEMARHAYRAQVRLVYLFEELRDDAEGLLGGAGSVAVLMQLGNGRQAQTAAEFIGHGFTFEVSQLSKQVGLSEMHGTNRSETNTKGWSETQGTNGSRSYGRHGGGSSEGWSESVTESWSTASTVGTSWAETRTENDGVTLQRSREFTVEPTQIQTLEETAFLLVDGGPQGRRVRMADCFPGTVLVPRRSDRPRLADGRR
jgi:hypothetical protein